MTSSTGGASQQNANSYMKWVSLVLLVIQTSSVVLTMRYSKMTPTHFGGKEAPPYLSSTAVVIAEFMKMVSSFFFVLNSCDYNLAKYRRTLVRGLGNLDEMKHIAVPAVLYLFQNNFLFLAISNLDAPTYQVSYQLKIFTTAILSTILLNKYLTLMKWAALAILFVGVCIVQLPQEALTGEKGIFSNFTETSNFKGLIFILMACFTSAFAGVYFEKLLKTSKTSVWIRNIQLGMYSFLFGGIGSYYYDQEAISEHGFLQGYNTIVWTVICLNAIGGLIVAAVIKYADNILKGFANAIAIISSTLCSYYILNDSTNINIKFALGASMVILATFLYTNSPAALKKQDGISGVSVYGFRSSNKVDNMHQA